MSLEAFSEAQSVTGQFHGVSKKDSLHIGDRVVKLQVSEVRVTEEPAFSDLEVQSMEFGCTVNTWDAQ